VTSAVAPSFVQPSNSRRNAAWTHLDRLQDVRVNGDGQVLSRNGRVGLDGDVFQLTWGQQSIPLELSIDSRSSPAAPAPLTSSIYTSMRAGPYRHPCAATMHAV
jgi:hypothetical protein